MSIYNEHIHIPFLYSCLHFICMSAIIGMKYKNHPIFRWMYEEITTMLKFLAVLKRKSIIKKGLRCCIGKTAYAPFLLTGVGALVFFAIAARLWEPSMGFALDAIDWKSDAAVIAICGAVFAALFIIWIPLSVVFKRRKLEVLNKLADRYGNLEENICEIEEQLKQKDITITVNGDYITKEWFISSSFDNICKISSIAAIIGIMGSGTFILLDDGEVIKTMFHQKKWGNIFSVFQASNPYILSAEDKITMPNGCDIDVYDAYRNRNLPLIIDEYLRNKNTEFSTTP